MMRQLELLSPAADKEIGKAAVLHGADAVYIGGPSHGARSKATNTIGDIRELVDFAHQYRAKVYVTVNTLVYEHELKDVERLVRELYEAGVDALIVQDMSLLRLDIPPIALHASTQCDTRTPAKARFLQEAGFSQIVLAREMSLDEIRKISDAVDVPVECFIHGALCVSYSGRCGASMMVTGRSANRGECSQMCRLPYDLVNGRGEIIERGKHLLSLRDFNASFHLAEMVEAGARSFKIEGRMKDKGYVCNVTAYYRRLLDKIIDASDGKYIRSSFGKSEYQFQPDLRKSFNRGFTDYFLSGREAGKRMASLLTPKSLGEEIRDIRLLHNGDGISFFNRQGEYEGTGVNGISGNRIITARRVEIPRDAVIYRTFDREWENQMSRISGSRRMWVDIEIGRKYVTARDERGVAATVAMPDDAAEADKPQDMRRIFGKLGNTPFELRNLDDKTGGKLFFPSSLLTETRRRLIDALQRANLATYPFDRRRTENKDIQYPEKTLIASDNVSNTLAEEFYRQHGVSEIERALETGKPVKKKDVEVMRTRYCLRRELGCCLKKGGGKGKYLPPLHIESGKNRFRLDFDCANCEMKVILPG